MRSPAARLAVFFACALAVCSACAARSGGHSRGRGGSSARESAKAVKAPPPVPVASGFADWTGFDTALPGNDYPLTASDLRGRFAVIVEIKGANAGDAVSQIKEACSLQGLGFNVTSATDWNFGTRRRDVIVVFNIHGQGGDIYERIKKDESLKKAMRQKYSLYTDVTFKGAPDSGGEYPFVYVIAPFGTEPIYKGKFNRKTTRNEIDAAIAKANGKTWRDYYGYVEKAGHVKGFDAAVASGKSLAQTETLLRKTVTGGAPEAAKEAQMLLDAVELERNNLLFRAEKSYKAAPLSAMYDLDEFARRWPSQKKETAGLYSKASSAPDVATAYKAYKVFRECSMEDYSPKDEAAAGKAAAEIRKFKPLLEKLKGSNTITVQNAAFTMLQLVDTLPDELPGKVSPRQK